MHCGYRNNKTVCAFVCQINVIYLEISKATIVRKYNNPINIKDSKLYKLKVRSRPTIIFSLKMWWINLNASASQMKLWSYINALDF